MRISSHATVSCKSRFADAPRWRRAAFVTPTAVTRTIITRTIVTRTIVILTIVTLTVAALLFADADHHARAQAPRTFSGAWFAKVPEQGRAAAARAGAATAPAATATSPSVSQSIAAFAKAAQAIAHAQAMQSQASAAAAASAVPNGLVTGGLQPNLTNWSNAAPPSQSSAAGRTTVTVQQTQPQALLTWGSFNVGQRTTLAFDQSAGGSSANTWLVLNRVNDPSAVPSQILGSITAQGQVLLINPNGIIFGAGAQVNVGALLASTAYLASSTFAGIYSQTSSQNGHVAYLPSFTGATNGITVAQGATIASNLPASGAGNGGLVIPGGVMLLGSSVENDGTISTPNAQTILAAGQSFILRQGYGTNTLPTSTTLGTEVAVTGGGAVTNTGLIQSSTGDVTMAGQSVTQAGVVYTTTSVTQRGTIHLLTDTSDASSSVTLAPGSLTTILPDTSGATASDAARATLIGQSATPTQQAAATQLNGGLLNNQVLLPDRGDQSRVEITTGGTADFATGSLTMATGGQIAVSAAKRVFAAAGAVLDVGGSVGVTLPASANTLAVAVQPFQLRDSPGNRDSGVLNSQTAYVNISQLTLIQAGTGGYPQDRYYTPGGLLEVGGELSNVAHTVQEWTTPGGTITLSSAQVVAQPAATFDIAGGSVSYQPGMVQTTWVIGTNGHLYNINTAPSDLTYTGIFSGFTETHPRWNITETFNNPLIAPAKIYQGGYTVGRDAGTLKISAPTAVFEATIDAGVVTGAQQSAARPSGSVDASLLLPNGSLDPFLLPEATVPLPGSLVLAAVGYQAAPFATDVQIDDAIAPVAATLDVGTPLPTTRQDTAWISASLLDGAGLGGLTIGTTRGIQVASPLTLANGGLVTLVAASVDVASPLTARGGSVTISNNESVLTGVANFVPISGSGITLEAGGAIDTRGLFTNLLLTPDATPDQAFAAGGAVTIDTTEGVYLAAGSLIDASSGGTVLATGKTAGAVGGAISVTAYDPAVGKLPAQMPFTIAGTLRSYGSTQGGALTLQVPGVVVGDASAAGAGNQAAGTGNQSTGNPLVLPAAFFAGGFSNYTIGSYSGISVASGTAVQVVEPVYQFVPATLAAPTGSDPSAAFALVLPPVYLANPANAQVTQRKGASLTLLSAFNVAAPPTFGGPIELGSGASISVDPGSSVRLEALGQLTVDGSITAPGGSISLNNATYQAASLTSSSPSYQAALSIWLGASSRLDVSAEAFTAADLSGRPFGVVPAGGTIQIGGFTDSSGNFHSTDAYLVSLPGSVLAAAGTSASIDPAAGTGQVAGSRQVASNGGSISLDSTSGLYLGGSITAPAGGAGAQGGAFSVALNTPLYFSELGQAVQSPLIVPRELTVTNGPGMTLPTGVMQPGDKMPNSAIGQTELTTSLLDGGGFDSLTLTAGDAIVFDGSPVVTAGRSITLNTGVLAASGPGVTASVAAPYVTLNGTANPTISGTLLQQLTPNAWNSSRRAGASLSIAAATNLDVSGNIFVGLGASAPALGTCTGATCTVDLAGFGQMTLASSGDIRFVPGAINTAPSGSIAYTTLTTPGDLTLIAGQIYPVLGARALVTAGFDLSVSDGNPFLPTGVLSIQQAPGPVPAVPMTAGGILQLAAGTIEQGGVVRAPMGQITVGENGSPGSYGPQFANGSTPYTYSVDLLPGSITSVSADGATIPYGGTADGVTYTLNGGSSPFDARTNSNNAANAPILTLTGQSVTMQSGATLDLSGGGTLAGAGFISGRGGSTDVLSYPLLATTSSGTVAAVPASTNLVFAILPGHSGVAPPTATSTGSTGPLPQAGDAITLLVGVPGLPAGTYVLLPGSDALLPGAFRVQINTASSTWLGGAVNIGNGNYQVNGYRAVAGTGVQAGLPVVVTVTPGAAVRLLAQYDEETYSQFELAQDALFGAPRILTPIPEDAKTLAIQFPAVPNPSGPALIIQGDVNMQPAANGLGGTARITAATDIVVTPDGAAPQAAVVSVPASALDALGADTLSIGGYPSPSLVVGAGSTINFLGASGGVTLQPGATLTASQVFLVGDADGGVSIEPGGGIDTLGRAVPSLNSSSGLLFNNNGLAVVAVSNGSLTFAPAGAATAPTGPVTIGICPAAGCNGASSLYAEGTITVVASGSVAIGPAAQFGAQTIDLSVPWINISTPASGQPVPPGLNLTQATLNALLNGNPASGIPALAQLTLAARNSVNFYGSATLDSGSLAQIELDTPAIYGAGGAGDAATLTLGSGTLIWNGIAAAGGGAAVPAGPWLAGGPGTGSGSLAITAANILLGYGPNEEAQSQTSLSRLMLGFSQVTLDASQSITTANRGSLAVYQSVGAYQAGTGTTYSGGNLKLVTPLLTGGAGSVNSITAGGTLEIGAPSGGPAATASAGALGAEIDLSAASISNATAIALPSGRLVMQAANDITLNDGSYLDLAGRLPTLFDQTLPSFGGAVVLQSANGNITQAAGAVVDVSAASNNAGSLSITATGASAGQVSLGGSIQGGAAAGFTAGSFQVAAQSLDPNIGFSALNDSLNAGGFFGSRSFDLKTGSLVIGSNVRAHNLSVSVDGGSLQVAGTIDASGGAPGSISLAASGGLTLDSTAVLDAHGSVLQADSTGQPIDAENQATVELSVPENTANPGASGTLTLQRGATINVGSPDPAPQGDVELNVPRTGSDTSGNANIVAVGPVTINGAKTVAVNAFWTYVPTDPNGTIVQDNHDPGGATVATSGADAGFVGLNQANAISQAFITNAAANPALQANLQGLAVYGRAFHLRPGVEIDSAPNGNLTVSGDLDLSGYRYSDPSAYGLQANPAAPGSGEPGVLALRAAGNLNVNGSINDGFSKPPEPAGCNPATASTCNPDDQGWVLTSTPTLDGSNLVLPDAVTLLATTQFPNSNVALAYAITVTQASAVLAANATVPTALTLSSPVTLPAGTVLRAAITDPTTGVTYPAGTLLGAATTLHRGSMLAAGTQLPVRLTFNASTPWPSGASLAAFASPVILAASVTVPAGATIPGNSKLALSSASSLAGGAACSNSGCNFRDVLTATPTSDGSNLGLPSAVTLLGSTVLTNGNVVLNSPITLGGTSVTIQGGTVLPAAWTLPVGTVLNASVTLPNGTVLPANTKLTAGNNTLPAGAKLGSGTQRLTVQTSATVAANKALTADEPLAASITIPANTVLAASITDGSGNVLSAYNASTGSSVPLTAGTTLTASTTLSLGALNATGNTFPEIVLKAGFKLPVSFRVSNNVVWPAGASLTDFTAPVTIATPLTMPAGSTIPGKSQLVLASQSTVPGGATCSDSGYCDLQAAPTVWAIAPMLPAGSQSWSVGLTAGADLAAANQGTLLSSAALTATTTVTNPTPGSIVLSDPHYQVLSSTTLQASWSVIRTGTGDLSLQAGGNVQEASLYGIYTAGTQTAAAPTYELPRATPFSGTAFGTAYTAYNALVSGSNYQAYYPDNGGNVLIAAQGNVTGDIEVATANAGSGEPVALDGVGGWLWRQGGVNGQQTAWWINFGTYVIPAIDASTSTELPTLAGFVGIGALGGGNVTLTAGGNAGVTAVGPVGAAYDGSSGLDLAVASTGRVNNGATTLTGGGNITVEVAGALNGASTSQDELNGTVTDLRGQVVVQARSIGQVALVYAQANTLDPRTISPLTAVDANSFGGLTLVPGDAGFDLQTLGDLVLGGVSDATRLFQQNLTPLGSSTTTSPPTVSLGTTTTVATTTNVFGNTWFSLWQPDTSVTLYSAGGNATPSTQSSALQQNGNLAFVANSDSGTSADGRFLYPPILRVEVPDGSIYAGGATNPGGVSIPASIELAPSPVGQLALLAGGSIFANQYAGGSEHGVPATFDISGASVGALPTPLQPAYNLVDLNVITTTATKPRTQPKTTIRTTATPGGTNLDLALFPGGGVPGLYPNNLFAFAADTATASLHAGDPTPALVYAGDDIVDLHLGETLTFGAALNVTPGIWYIAGKAVQMLAGGDIVGSGTPPGASNPAPSGVTSTGDLIFDANASDVSEIEAGQDIIYANVAIAGPGQLWVQAGRNVYQADQGVITSLGADPGAPAGSGGAAITVLAGAGASGPDWTSFANLYLNPADQAPAGTPVGLGTGVVVQSYADQLVAFLQQNYSYQGTAANALAFFEALPIAQQRRFLLGIYFDELRDGGREFNDPTSMRYKLYTRGDEAIAALFPDQAAYNGDLTLFGGSGIHTVHGGSITLLVPGGNTILGVQTGKAPPATAGVLTEGGGDIDIYDWGISRTGGTQGVALGQSRIFTILGGNIVIWSENGDINAGRGANTTSVSTPVNIAYDADGNIFLSPSAAVTGAGIATLAPVAGTAPGDLDLVAPNGVIDAGEAGIRASGNASLAALTVVNAANVQVTGKASGLPTVVAPNLGALSAASATAAAAAQSAQQMQANTAPSATQPPSNITVEVTGFGDSGG